MKNAVCGALAVTSLALATSCGPMEVEGAQVASRRDAIVNGQVTFDDPEVFFFESPLGVCSSTLIGRRTLLTAAHCVTDESGGVITSTDVWATNVVDSLHARLVDYVKVTAVRRHPDYVPLGGAQSGGAYSQNDVAMLRLDREPPVPLKVWNSDPMTDNMLSGPLRLVGYGDTREGSGYGLKRTGVSSLLTIRPLHIQYDELGERKGNTCQGDSGGPAMMTFPDGSERVVAVTSYGKQGCKGASTSARVDAYVTYIRAGLSLYESSCAADGLCKAGCTPVDPDCACVADGTCNAACVAPSIDPDCAAACGNNGVCGTTLAACAADPDCEAVGASCGYDAHCASRLCITSAQHARPYCSRTCAQPADCPGDMECTSNQCRFKVRPTATLGQVCTLGVTLCEGAQSFCATWDTQPVAHCARGCMEDADCGDATRPAAEWAGTCRATPYAPGVCVPSVVFPILGVESSTVKGCASIPGGLLALVALVGLGRRRPPRGCVR